MVHALSTYFSHARTSVVARNNDILKKLVLEAKKEYEKDAVHRVHIFMADTCVAIHSSLFPRILMMLSDRTAAGVGTAQDKSAR